MKKIAIAGIIIASAAMANAELMAFKVVGDKLQYRNSATVESVTEFETFTGRTTGVSGNLKFDPIKKTGSGKIVIDLKSIDTGIPARNDHMNGEMWLNTGKFPTATFETTKVKFVKGETYSVTGKFTLHGVTKTIVTPVTVKYRAASAQVKAAGFEGNVVQFSTKFKVKLSDYGVMIPAMAKGKVAETVNIAVSAYASTK